MRASSSPILSARCGSSELRKDALAGGELKNFRADMKADAAADDVAIFLPRMRHHQVHAIFAREGQMKDLEIVVGHAAGKQPPAIAGGGNAQVFALVAKAMHGDVAAKLVDGIVEQFADADVERLRNLDQVRNRA